MMRGQRGGTGFWCAPLGRELASARGIGAGVDPGGKKLESWAAAGAGFLEIGTFTHASPAAQGSGRKITAILTEPGHAWTSLPTRGMGAVALTAHRAARQVRRWNQDRRQSRQPRWFPLPEDHALLGAPGFARTDASTAAGNILAHRRKAKKHTLAVGASITWKPGPRGRWDSILALARVLAPAVDYLALPVAPRTLPGLLAGPAELGTGPTIAALRAETLTATGRDLPILVKLNAESGPDFTEALIQEALEAGAAGFVAGGWRLRRENLRTDPYELIRHGPTALCGAPLLEGTLELCAHVRQEAGTSPLIIADGGVMDHDDHLAALAAGADLTQSATAHLLRA